MSASSASRASATSVAADSLSASMRATLTFTKRTPSAANTVREAVVKSLYRVPTPMTRSASAATASAAVVPVAPIAPSACGWSYGSEPLPACVSPTGIPVASAKAASAASAPA